MTKSEFDDAFLDGNVCIMHKNKDEWAEICSYAATLGVKPQSIIGLPNGEHNCHAYPYACVDRAHHAMSARSNAARFEWTLSFEEFCSAINNDVTIEFQCDDLNTIL